MDSYNYGVMRKFIRIGCAILVVVMVSCDLDKITQKMKDSYDMPIMDRPKFNFAGRVEYVNNLRFTYSQVIGLDQVKCDVKNYDPRANHESYFAVIKENKAELLVRNIYNIEVGDSLIYDCNTEHVSVLRNGQIVLEFKPITHDNFFYETKKKLKEEHKL